VYTKDYVRLATFKRTCYRTKLSFGLSSDSKKMLIS
jgi:hypothetical protein